MEFEPRIIGVSGTMRTGKDSVALLLKEFGYERASFADPLRKLALDIDPYILLQGAPDDIKSERLVAAYSGSGAILYSDLISTIGYERAKEIPDFRRFLQRLGTEGIRGNFGQDAWVNLFKKQVMGSPGAKFVAPDCRFPNEAAAIREMGGVIWRTVRPGYGGGTHPSESMVDEITPDVTLVADNLIDLGKLVLAQIDHEDDEPVLQGWADSILGVTVGT